VAPKLESESNEQPVVKSPFHQRFNIEVDREEAEKRFINRIINQLDKWFPSLGETGDYGGYEYEYSRRNIAYRLGQKYERRKPYYEYFRGNLYNCIQALEALYEVFGDSDARKLSEITEDCLSLSEVDLDIAWRDGSFRSSGAKLLDEDLVNVNLKWLSDFKYQQVLEPFAKGLHHFLEANKEPEKLADTVTDMYEAIEAMAKIATHNNSDLSANREKFIKILKVNRYYKGMLGDYIDYANQYRHAVSPNEKREIPKRNEVEAFYYITGIFIRLSIQKLQST